jgi:arylsulfatase A-like enzyme
MHRAIVLTFSAVFTAISPSNAAIGGDESPNFVFILADDMGYGDVHALNPDSKIPTPNLDGLAAAGMTFTDAHSPSAVCTPTRYGLVTGRYCWRSRLKRGVQNGYGPQLIENERPTVASYLKSNGYKTGIVGKWHLGLGFAKKADGKAIDYTKPLTHGPNDLGFDYSYIIPASLDFPPYVYFRNGQATEPSTVTQPAQKFPPFLRNGPRAADLVMENCLDDLARDAVKFIQEESTNKAQPFFLYFPLTAPHKPVLPHPRFRGKTQLGPYGDFIVQVDWTVGEVLKALDAAGIADNTVVIYSSDNGSFMYRRDEADATGHVDDQTVQAYRASNHTANHVFRGTKADVWEAGHRVPFFARWPGTIKPGSKCSDTICLTDFFATAAEVIGKDPPKGAAPDSFSFLSQLKGGKPEAARPPVINHSASGMFAIRDGKWKLVLGNGSGGRERPSGRPFQKPYQLFDLAEDVSEKRNVIEKYPEIAARLEKHCQAIIDQK